jgi:hypothetical protein
MLKWFFRRRWWDFIAWLKFAGAKPLEIKSPPDKWNRIESEPMIKAIPEVPLRRVMVCPYTAIPRDERKLIPTVFYRFQVWLYTFISPMQPFRVLHQALRPRPPHERVGVGLRLVRWLRAPPRADENRFARVVPQRSRQAAGLPHSLQSRNIHHADRSAVGTSLQNCVVRRFHTPFARASLQLGALGGRRSVGDCDAEQPLG